MNRPTRSISTTSSAFRFAVGRLPRVLGLLCLQILACHRDNGLRPVTIAGSSSVQPYVERWAESLQDSAEPARALRFDIQGGGSSAGIRAVREGAAVIGMSSRDLENSERAGLRRIEVARDAITVIVHRQNPLASMSTEQIAAVFAGHVRSWSELGVSGARITVITREEGSGTRSAFESLAMRGLSITPRALVQDAAGAIRELVATDPAAIGYISLGLLDDRVRAVPLSGVAPSEAAVRSGRYPLVRPFLLLMRDPAADVPIGAKQFLEFVLSANGQAIARSEGLLPAE